jgi:hypothetical protein
MSGEHDNLVAPDPAPDGAPTGGAAARPAPGQPPGQPSSITINGMPVYIAAPPPPPLRERTRTLRADFKTWLAGAPLAPGEMPGMDVFERDATEVMSRQHTLRARQIARMAVFVIVALIVWAGLAVSSSRSWYTKATRSRSGNCC